MTSLGNIRSVCSSLSRLSVGRSHLLPAGYNTGIVSSQSNVIGCPTFNFVRGFTFNPEQAKPEAHIYRAKVHYPNDEQYTTKTLRMTKLGGRDPYTGRVIVGTLGGGEKRRSRWVDTQRCGPLTDKENELKITETEPGVFVERIISVERDPNQSGYIALVGSGDKLRYILATEGMQVGDIIKNSTIIPRMLILPNDGDAHPIGALPIGTKICNIEIVPGLGARFVISAASFAVIKSIQINKVIVQLPHKHLIALDKTCIVNVGRVSNVTNAGAPLGSPNMLRWMGWRSRSGLWQRKDGYCGRKIRPLPATKHFDDKPKVEPRTVRFNLPSEESRPTYVYF